MGHGRLTSPLRGISAMRLVARRGLLAALACLFLSPAFSSPAFASCEYVIAGKSFWIRLIDPVASYSSKLGTTVRAVLIRSEEHTSELRHTVISYAVFCLKKKKKRLRLFVLY